MLIQKWFKGENEELVWAVIVGMDTKMVVISQEETIEFNLIPEDEREPLIPSEVTDVLVKNGYQCMGMPEYC